jgi:hypothetical protein
LVGVHRTHYAEVGNLELVGVAAWPWRAASGYEGLTVLFWDRIGRRWNEWSDVRPRQQGAGFDPVARYTQPGPWEGVESPKQLARHRLRLQHARRNALGRLSSSTRSRALITGKAEVSSLEWTVWSDWSKLARRVDERGSAVGLREVNALESVVVVRPSGCGRREFDPVTQVLRWPILDASGCELVLMLAYTDLTGPAIDRLETLESDRLAGGVIVGRLQPRQAGLVLEPISLHTADGRVCHLALDLRKPAAAIAPAVSAPATLDDDLTDDLPDSAVGGGQAEAGVLGRVLGEAEDRLLALAECGVGCGPVRALAGVAGWVEQARAHHLEILANAFERVAAAAGNPEPLLRCAYLLQLHRRAAAVTGFGEVPGQRRL